MQSTYKTMSPDHFSLNIFGCNPKYLVKKINKIKKKANSKTLHSNLLQCDHSEPL